MKQRTFFKVLCVVLLLTLLIPSAGLTRAREGIDAPTSDDYVTGELLVKFTSEVSPTAINGGVQTGIASLDELIEEYDVRAAEPLFSQVTDSKQGLENIYKMDLPETADVLAAAAVFGADTHVEYAEPNYTYQVMGEKSHDLFGPENDDAESYYLPWPAGDNLYVIQGNNDSPTHSGKFQYAWDFSEDITGTIEGHLIVAVADGTVKVAKNDADGWGYYVVIEHPEADGSPKYSLYGHLQEIDESVKVGESIKQGEPVGKLGKSGGMSNGVAHLHFQFMDAVWEGGTTASSVPGSFSEVSGDGVPQEDQWYTSQNSSASPDLTDPLLRYEWGLDNTGQTGGKEDADIDAPEAWGITTGVTETLVAVIDTGVDYNHEDLNDGRVRTDIDQDYVNDDDDAMDDHSHGTHVAGTIAAETNNGVGVAGVMWQAQILPLKVLSSQGSGSADDVAAAIRYAADQETDVINMSLGSRSCSQTIADAVNYAYDKGVIIVAAAGNSGSSIGYPAKHAPVIAVGATDHNDHKAYFSNYGDELDVVAPGVSVFSTVPNNGYDAFSGTSMASPHVAGVVGLLLSQRSDLSNGQVREILRQSADDLGQGGFDTYYGYGRVNAYQALQAETPEEPPAPEDAECTSTGPCAAGVAVEGTDDGTSILSDLRAVRDEVFTEDPGQRWVDIYYKHQGEVAWLLATHKDLRADALAGFRAFAPVFRAGLGEGPSVTLTPDLIEAAREALMGVAEHGSEEIHDDIVREWEKVDPSRFVGQDVLEVWEQLKQEERTMKVYLPLVMK